MREVLEEICTQPTREARWLHTVSMMEFIGARKIGKTVASRHPSEQILEHWADETRHACAFKRLANELWPGDDDCQGYLCPEAAHTYFQRLDHEATAWLAESAGRTDVHANYLLVTTLIERRAMRLYPLFKSITTHEFVAEELQRVILEEADHRAEIEQACREMLESCGAGFDEAVALEESLLDDLRDALRAELTPEA
jgi:rubrerythrin